MTLASELGKRSAAGARRVVNLIRTRRTPVHRLLSALVLMSWPIATVANLISRFGERTGVEFLVYNPFLFISYHGIALRYADAVTEEIAAQFPDAKTYFDVGSGSGAYAAAAKRRGFTVISCEHSRLARSIARLQGVDSRPFDLTEEIPTDVDGSYDLAVSFEVAEHLTPELGERMVDFMAGRAALIVFTAAAPGQGGHGHIHEQPREYWIERFRRHGFSHSAAESRDLSSRWRRAEAPSWLVDNVIVLRRDRAATKS